MSSVSGSRGVRMFVPNSVVRRAQGLRRIPGQYNTWVPEKVLSEMQDRKTSGRIRRVFMDSIRADEDMVRMYSGVRWGDVIVSDEEDRDASYLTMSSTEFIEAMKTMKKSDIARVFNKRRDAQSRKPIVIPEPSPDAEYKYWVNEYTNYGYLYFSSEEQQQEALENLEHEFKPKSNSKFAMLDEE
jgi:hypothetical protein